MPALQVSQTAKNHRHLSFFQIGLLLELEQYLGT
jgi:hypothetical protein